MQYRYADDTENSLLDTLVLLDNFYKISGLKVNIDKTNAIWIGSKKGSAETMCNNYHINWIGNDSFNYLGVILCTDLDVVVNINYSTTMQAITKLIHHWSKRYLTVLGRIVVVKSLLLPKLNHLVLSLPSPDAKVINDINTQFYHFIWGGKVDRLSRNQMTQPYDRGGTGMVQFDIFSKAQNNMD